MKSSRGILLNALLALAGSGCLSSALRSDRAPYGKGPTFQIAGETVSTGTAVIPISIVDRRPDWEKIYYPGSTMLHRPDYAVSFVPMENFQPSIRNCLVGEIQRRAASLSAAPSSVEIQLTSFWLVYDERPVRTARFQEAEAIRLQEEQRREREEAERKREEEERERERAAWNEQFGKEKKEEKEEKGKPPGFGEQIVGELMVGLLGIFAKATYEQTKLAIQESRRGELHLGRPPEAITKEYDPGLSCRIDALVTVRWKDGRTREVHLKRVYFPATGSTEYTASDIPRAVADCVRGLGGDFLRQSEAYLGGRSKPAKPL
jgi:hypothetical protein